MARARKAVITAAGRGTRQYPASSAVQKEMFPLVDRDGLTKPVIQIIGEEAIDSGIEEICIITQPGEEKLYREYFRPDSERELHKDRRRWHIYYQGVLFYINVDRVLKPEFGDTFIEIKSRTWSASDAENKADRIQAMLKIIGISPPDILQDEYLEFEVSR